MSPISPVPQPADEIFRSDHEGGRVWNFDSFSWLAPKVPLRQVIYALGAGQEPLREQFRLLRTRLEDLRRTRSLKSILITSSLTGEGKSFVTLNLAAAVSQRGRNKVLLLEADLCHPSCCAALGLSPVPGLTECCGSAEPTTSFVYRVSGLDLFLLPAGQQPRAEMELLSSRRASQILAETSRVFDWVLIDSAPLLPVADSVALSRWCDGILLVVRRRRALKSALREALSRIEPAKLLGIVLNDFPAHHSCKAYFQSLAEPASGKVLGITEEKKAA
ncbi:MAG: tyrosine-protein kinase family protein [Chlamydiota bacterium]